MDSTADPIAIATDLLARTRIKPFRHDGRPCLALSLPTGTADDMTMTALLVTESDGALTGRTLLGLGFPDRHRVRKAIAEAPRPGFRELPLFVAGASRACDFLVDPVRRSADASGRSPATHAVRTLVAGPLSARLAEALAGAGLAPQHALALAALGRIGRPSSALLKALSGPPEPWRARAAECCERAPVLAELVTDSAGPDDAKVRDRLSAGPDALGAALIDHFEAAYGPGLTPARLARLGTAGVPEDTSRPIGLWAFLLLLREAPIDWIRPESPAIGAMLDLAPAFRSLAIIPGMDPAALLRPARGNWPAFLARCLEAGQDKDGPAGPDVLATRAEGVSDMLRHFASRVMLPLLARAEPPADGVPPDHDERTMRAARSLLLADKGLPAILEASALWHRLAARIEARMPSGTAATWDPPCPPFRASNGVEVRPLASAMDLVDEGAAGLDADGVPGLAHCVASYRTLAQGGHCHILSVRSADGRSRLSTVEVKVDAYGRARVAQHRGLRNAPAPPEAVRAVGEFVTAVRLPPPPPGAPDKPSPLGRIGRACGYDWRDDSLVRLAALAYAEFLPRDLRGADLDRLAERAGFGSPEPAAAPFAPGP